jgi:hypothetical protein
MMQAMDNMRGQRWPLADFVAAPAISGRARDWARAGLATGAAGQTLWWAPVAGRAGFALVYLTDLPRDFSSICD